MSTFNPAAVITNGAAYEQHELSSTDKEILDKKIGVAKRAGWIVRGIRHSSDGLHMATMVRRPIDPETSAKV